MRNITIRLSEKIPRLPGGALARPREKTQDGLPKQAVFQSI